MVRKVIRNYPHVQKTSFIGEPFKQIQPETTIKPSVFQKLVILPLFLFALLFYIPLFNSFLNKKLPILIPTLGILFLSLIIYLLIWHSFFNPKYIYRIVLNKDYIRIRDKKFYWQEIAETCIMTRQERRTGNSYLVILKKDSTVEKFDLFKFAITNKKLASIIESYKKKNTSMI